MKSECYICNEPLTSDDFKQDKFVDVDIYRTFSGTDVVHKKCTPYMPIEWQESINNVL